MFINSSQIAMLLGWFVGWCVFAGLLFACQRESPQVDQKGVEQNFFRQTRFGWQDCRSWQSQPQIFEETPVHPLTTATLLLLGSLGVFIWASEDDEIAEMLGAAPPSRRSSVPQVHRISQGQSRQ